jgi:hypothetical protein
MRVASLLPGRISSPSLNLPTGIHPNLTMKFSSIIWSTCLLTTSVLAQSGLTGLPTNPYDPYCAMACLRSLYTLNLACSTSGGTLGMLTFTTSSECWATNTPYLTSLAWCINTKCAQYDESASKLEYFWENQATGQSDAGVATVPAKMVICRGACAGHFTT